MYFYFMPAAWVESSWAMLVNHLWQATLFALIVWLAAAAMSGVPARARHLAWLLAFGKFVLPPALLVLPISLSGPRPVREAIVETAAHAPIAATGLSSVADAGVKIMFQIAQPAQQRAVAPIAAAGAKNNAAGAWSALIMTVWLVGVVIVLGHWIIRRWRLARSLRSAPRLTSGREADALNRAIGWLAIRREVGLIVSTEVKEPGVWRSFRPIVLLPAGLVERLTDEELETVMMHELVHILHHDNLIGVLQVIVCGVFWFYPVIWLIDRRLLAERELICDEQVVTLSGKPEIYAAGLWKIAQFGLGWPVAGVSLAAGSNLRKRIEKMLSAEYQLSHLPRRRFAAGAIVGLLVVVALTFGLLANAGALTPTGERAPIAGGVRGGIDGGIDGGVPGRLASLKGFNGGRRQVFELPPDWRERLDAAPGQAIHFENAPGAPIAITDVKTKVFDFGGYYAVHSIVTLEGQSDRAIESASIQHYNQQSSSAINDETWYMNLHRGQTASVNKIWFLEREKAIVLNEYQQNLVVKIASLKFTDETLTEKWYRRLTGSKYERLVSSVASNGVDPGDLAPYFSAKFENLPEALLTVTDAVVRLREIWVVDESHCNIRFNMNCSFANLSDHGVSSYRLEINNPGAVTGPIGGGSGWQPKPKTLIEPRSAWEPPGGFAMSINTGRNIGEAAGNFRIRILEAGFEDGSYWTSDMSMTLFGFGRARSQPLTSFAWAARGGQSLLSRLTGSLLSGNDAQSVGSTLDSQTEENLPEVRDLVDKSEVSSLPRVFHSMSPGYTPEARKKGTHGTATLSAIFRSDGRISGVEVIQPLPDGLTERAITSAKNLIFEPAKKGGHAVSMRANIEYRFSIDPREPREVFQTANPSTRSPYDVQPFITYQEKAEYTPQAKANRVAGSVRLSMVFGIDGQLHDIRVLSGLPDGLTERAIEAAKKLRFRPGTKDRQDADYTGTVEYKFSLD